MSGYWVYDLTRNRSTTAVILGAAAMSAWILFGSDGRALLLTWYFLMAVLLLWVLMSLPLITVLKRRTPGWIGSVTGGRPASAEQWRSHSRAQRIFAVQLRLFELYASTVLGTGLAVIVFQVLARVPASFGLKW